MGENIDDLLKEIRQKNIAKRRDRLLNRGQGQDSAHRKKTKRRKHAIYIKAAARLRSMDLGRKRSGARFNDEELREIALRIEGKK